MPTERIERFGVASCALSATGTSGAWTWDSARARRWLERKGAGRSANRVVRVEPYDAAKDEHTLIYRDVTEFQQAAVVHYKGWNGQDRHTRRI